MSCEIYEIWDELCSNLFSIAPDYHALLATGTSGLAIAAVERNLCLEFPQAYSEFLRMHNGTRGNLFMTFEFLSIHEVRAATHSKRASHSSSDRNFLEGGWDQQKVCIGDSQIGWEMVLDCESQAVFVYAQSNYALQLAESFQDYVAGLRDNLKNGHYEIVKGKVFMGEWGVRW